MSKCLTDAEYRVRLAEIGKVEALEEYKDHKTRILHRCLRHGEIYLSWPGKRLRGGGLACCHADEVRERGERKLAEAASRYAERLAEMGRAEALEPYRGNTVKIVHRCLLHGKTQLVSPKQLLGGWGLKCCLAEVVKIEGRRKLEEASKSYKARIAALGKVEVLEDYKGASTKILHRCLKHGEVHLAQPANILQGGGLHCCQGGGESYTRFVNDKSWVDSPCKLYLANVNGAYLKPGIAKDEEARAKTSGGFYKGYQFVSPTLTRAEAWAIEQCLLIESQHAKPDQLPTEYEDWGGRTELRLKDVLPASWYIERFHQLLEQLAEVGWEELYLTTTTN